MKTQLVQDHNGKPMGVFIPYKDWENIKKYYPNIEKVDDDLPEWQIDLLDNRLADLNNPDKLEPIEVLFKVLDEE